MATCYFISILAKRMFNFSFKNFRYIIKKMGFFNITALIDIVSKRYVIFGTSKVILDFRTSNLNLKCVLFYR